ncbi:MAG: aminotransferase class V-fold PLP-dependent enzyme, partial [Planctomycetota bacterium]
MAKLSDNSGSIGADWAVFRRQMPVTRRWAYLDHAAVAPLTAPAQDALEKWAADAAQNGATPYSYSAWMQKLEQLRTLAARMIAAEPQEIALVRNTTEGITLVAEG